MLLLQMTSTRPYLRKKAVLLMYKVFLKFPDALRPAFPRLKEKLEDPDPGMILQDKFDNMMFLFTISWRHLYSCRNNPRFFLWYFPMQRLSS